MLLKQLKQFTLSATLRNAVFRNDVERLARFYCSPAVCQSLKTSHSPRRVSRDDRRAMIEAFVSEYRAANGGKFPTFNATQKEVGGSYYVVREILQELKLKPSTPLPIIAKPLSQVSASLPNDTPIVSKPLSEVSASVPDDTPMVSKPLSEVSASVPDDTPTVSEPLSEVSASIPNDTPIVSEPLSEVSASVPNDTPLNDTDIDRQSHSSASVANDAKLLSEVSASVANDAKLLSEVSASVANDASSGALNDADTDSQSHSSACNAKHFSDAVVDPVSQAASSDAIKSGSDSRQATLELSHPDPDESNLQGNNLVITATDDSKQDSETKKEEKLTDLGSQESKADHLEGAAVSANVVLTAAAETTRQVSERGVVEEKTGERSSAWSNIISFAKGFANYWRKG